ncbi:hypothetical protein A9179_16640 [Pseudomonas alcaligenes]|uniref:Uncharacterized protein n=1 Tax=Aquipseudomonas alcaligenes TaxID=43263 RepID=A0ABR7S2W5_AQUAC|nr:hypothetical protein [Pseudomonas alcaligenes]MBC9251900.1 hypothetical protein [Pseudomonas alcaligenes]
MLPNFQRHIGRYAFSLWLGLSLLCLLLTWALLRNSPQLGVPALLLAGMCIAFTATLGAVRDAPGYWIYAARALKFMPGQGELARLHQLRVTPLINGLNPLKQPFVLPGLVTLLVALLLLAGQALWPAHLELLALGVLCGVLPLLLGLILAASAPYFMALVSIEGEAALAGHLKQPRDARRYRLEDLGISLLLTLSLIWPLQDKPAFSLQGGYGTPEFIVAAVILAWVAAFFSLFGARRSRLFAQVGEQLSSLVRCESPRPRRESALLLRHAGYAALIAAWAVLLCLVLAALPQRLPFPLFCALLLAAQGWAFWRERGLTLLRDDRMARQFIDEMQVLPVAAGMPQRL